MSLPHRIYVHVYHHHHHRGRCSQIVHSYSIVQIDLMLMECTVRVDDRVVVTAAVESVPGLENATKVDLFRFGDDATLG